MPQVLEAEQPDHSQGFCHDAPTHFRLADLTICEGDGDLDDTQAALMTAVGDLDLKRIAGGMNRVEVQ